MIYFYKYEFERWEYLPSLAPFLLLFVVSGPSARWRRRRRGGEREREREGDSRNNSPPMISHWFPIDFRHFDYEQNNNKTTRTKKCCCCSFAYDWHRTNIHWISDWIGGESKWNALKLLWNCTEIAPKLLWNCFKIALKLLGNSSGTALKLFYNCSEICPETALKLLLNCS